MLFGRKDKDPREADEIARVEQFLQELRSLPQFISLGGRTLLHGISGCKVIAEGVDVKLAWVDPYAGHDGRVVLLPISEQDKYLRLMKAQAGALS